MVISINPSSPVIIGKWEVQNKKIILSYSNDELFASISDGFSTKELSTKELTFRAFTNLTMPEENLEKAVNKVAAEIIKFMKNSSVSRDAFQIYQLIAETKCRKEKFLEFHSSLSSYLPNPKDQEEFNEIVSIYKNANNFLDGILSYILVTEKSLVTLVLAAFYYEAIKNAEKAFECYFTLFEMQIQNQSFESALICLKKAEFFKKQESSIAWAEFLERIPRKYLYLLLEKYPSNSFLDNLHLQKDAVRICFEGYLSQFRGYQSKKSCYVSYYENEHDIGNWFKNILLGDLERSGIQTVSCLDYEGNVNDVITNIRNTDQIIILSTPEINRICEERHFNPTGVAMEMYIAKMRYVDRRGTSFAIIMKGDLKSALPDFLERLITPCNEKILSRYYTNLFALLAKMWNVEKILGEITEKFSTNINLIREGNIDVPKVKNWGKSLSQRNQKVLDEVLGRLRDQFQLTNVSFPIDSTSFIPRNELKTLENLASIPNFRICLVGTAGIGKTDLALRYAKLHSTRFKIIYKISGKKENFIKDLLQFANKAFPDINSPNLNFLKKQLELLSDSFLLIVDGVDELTFSLLNNYLPERKGCVLLTTRISNLAYVRNYYESIEIKSIAVEVAADFLVEKTGKNDERETALQLARMAGGHPAALFHLLKTMDCLKCSFSELLKNPLAFENLSIWNEDLEKISKLAFGLESIELLTFFSFFSEDIPLFLIELWTNKFIPDLNELDLDNCIGNLIQNSLLESKKHDFYDIHPLFQNIIRQRLLLPDRYKKLMQISQFILDFLKSDCENSKIALVMPHCKKIMEHLLIMKTLFSQNSIEHKTIQKNFTELSSSYSRHH